MYFPGIDPIEHSIQLTQNSATRTSSGTPASALVIVGVSQTIRQRNARELEPDPVVYVPRPALAQSNRATILVRAARTEAETTALLREEIRALDPDMPIFNVRTLEADLAAQRWPLLVVGSMFGVFAGLGLVMSAVGLFGLTSYTVSKRMQEIALRLALGAPPASVLWLLFGRVAAQITLGLTLGVAGAYGVGQILQGLLVQTSATDPMVLTGVGVVLMMVAVMTCLVPARRAMRIQPVAVLRSSQP
jgi:putative ABC transport system permease protein